MKKKRLLALLVAVVMVFATLALAACANEAPADPEPAPQEDVVEPDPEPDDGDDDADVDEPEVDEPDEDDGDDEVAEDPPAQGGGIFRMAEGAPDGRFTPITSDTVHCALINSLIFDGLISNNEAGEPIPWAATWEVSDDHLTYTFTLMDGVMFSDGVPMTSADVAFTYTTIAHPDYDGPRFYAVSPMVGAVAFREGEADTFEGIEIVDERTISFTFYEASPVNIWSFGYGIMPEHHYAFEDWNDFLDLEREPLGSGRFIFEEFRPMEFVRLARNDNHWNPDRMPYLDGILMMDIARDVALDALAAGQIDGSQITASLDNYNELQAMAGVDAVIFLGNGYQYMEFNTLRPTLADHRVRQALMYALDREVFLEATLGPLGMMGMAPISPVSWAFPEGGGDLNPYAFNMERAVELMEEAGWEMGPDGVRVNADGVRMELVWPVYTEVPWPGLLAELAFDSWGELGVELTIDLMDFNTVRELTGLPPGEKDFCVYVMGFSLAIDPDPSGTMFDADAFVEGGFNNNGFRHEGAQELLARGRASTDQAERTEIYIEFAQLMNYYLPTVILAYRYDMFGVSSNVVGFNVSAYQDWASVMHYVRFID